MAQCQEDDVHVDGHGARSSRFAVHSTLQAVTMTEQVKLKKKWRCNYFLCHPISIKVNRKCRLCHGRHKCEFIMRMLVCTAVLKPIDRVEHDVGESLSICEKDKREENELPFERLMPLLMSLMSHERADTESIVRCTRGTSKKAVWRSEEHTLANFSLLAALLSPSLLSTANC